MSLVEAWQSLESGLPADWVTARVELAVGSGDLERAPALLGPAQPWRAASGALRFDVARDGSARNPNAIRRLLARLDDAGIEGALTLVSAENAPARAAAAEKTLAQSWDEAIATLPADWSDLVGEIDLISSDYLELAALQLAPINPRLLPGTLTLRFRAARRFGYGASPGMARRCLERCDAKGIRGRVRAVYALSDTHPVATQGPVWQIGGWTV
jgi:hypothetical protein